MVQINLSLTNHPQIDEQIEKVIEYWNNTFDVQSITIKIIGSTFCPWLEFAYNNTSHLSFVYFSLFCKLWTTP
jgi:hypothetical protein